MFPAVSPHFPTISPHFHHIFTPGAPKTQALAILEHLEAHDSLADVRATAMGEIAILTKEHLAWRRSQGGNGVGEPGRSRGWGWQLYGFYHGFIMVLSWFYHVGVSENRLNPYTQWFCWSDNPDFKWLFHWEYTLFSDKPMCLSMVFIMFHLLLMDMLIHLLIWWCWWRMVNMVQLNSREETCLGIITRWSSRKKLWQVSCTARIAAISSPGSGGYKITNDRNTTRQWCEADDAMSWDGSLQPQSMKSTAMKYVQSRDTPQ